MKTASLRTIPLLALLTLGPLSARAQVQAAGADPFSSHAPDELRMDVAFEHATAGEIAEYLKATSKTSLNIIFMDEEASRKVLPSLQLNNVTADEVLLLLNKLGTIETDQGGRGYRIDPVEGVAGTHVFLFASPPANGISGAASGVPDSVFLDLADVLNDRITVDDVTTAIHTAWGSAAGKPAPEALRFHEETKLLIVSASPERIAVAVNLVNLLQSRATAAGNNEAGKRIQELLNQTNRLEMQNGDLKKELNESLTRQQAMQEEQQRRIMELEIELAKSRLVK